ncbi:hypothetical protein ACFW04_011960 [Cataglyphis niger]
MKRQGVIEESRSLWMSPAVKVKKKDGSIRSVGFFLFSLLSKICLVYLYDFIIFGKSFEEMIQRLKTVFLRFRTAGMKLNRKKCSFLKKSVLMKYLSHIILNDGVATDPEKIFAVTNWQISQTKKQLRSFLGFCSYYRKFVKGFSLIAKRYNQYDFEILYRKGNSHLNADGFSRRPCEKNPCKYCTKVEIKDVGGLEKIGRIILRKEVSNEWRKEVISILKEARDSSSGGHFGVTKILAKIRQGFHWATCKKDVEEWCRSFVVCIAKAGPSGKSKSPLQIYNIGNPFDRVQMDILGLLPKTFSGKRYLFVVTDCFSK